ncbi:MAG TPA: head GIN domain-containing protein [Chitinophagaceae bacterium]|nr:head GIN domain-containing protein [Chitinophagaceae bacterium]
MKRFFSVFIIGIAISLLHGGCQKPGCIGHAGATISQERPLSAFTVLTLEDNINFELVQGDTEKIEIDGPENVLPNIQTEISGQTLTISNKTDCRWLRDASEKITVHIFFKDLKEINYNGSGDVTNLDTLKLNSLNLSSEKGAGNVNLTVQAEYLNVSNLKENAGFILKGSARYCGIYSNARGQLNITDFVINNLTIIYSGLADTYIQVINSLDATIRYKGNIYYKGNPVITRSDYFSSGRLIKIP